MRLRIPHVVGTLSAVALVLGLAGGALALPPAGTVDQKHECASAGCNAAVTIGTYPITAEFLGGTDPQNVSLGQTFTAGATGHVTAVEVFVSTFDTSVPASFDVRVESTTAGKPSGTVLGTKTVPTSGIGTQHEWVTVQFATPIQVTKNTVYAITLAPIASVPTKQEWLSWGLDSTGVAAYTDYTRGDAFAYAAGGGGWSSAGDAFFDGINGTSDFAFRTILAAASAPTPTASIPSQPPTETLAAEPGSSAGGGLSATLLLLAVVGLVAFVAVVRPVRRRR